MGSVGGPGLVGSVPSRGCFGRCWGLSSSRTELVPAAAPKLLLTELVPAAAPQLLLPALLWGHLCDSWAVLESYTCKIGQ